jgi:hypothetical protein
MMALGAWQDHDAPVMYITRVSLSETYGPPNSGCHEGTVGTII